MVPNDEDFRTAMRGIVARSGLSMRALSAAMGRDPGYVARGDIARRLHTRTRLVEVEVGPYLVVGRAHGTPTSEPLGIALRRQAWVPLTEATVMYRCGGSDVREEMATLLVNRDRMRSFRAIDQPSLDLRWDKPQAPKDAAPAETPSTATLRKAARPRTKKARPPASSKPTA